VDLRFHDPDRAAQLLGDPLGLLRGVGDIAARHRHSVPVQQALRLIFMDIYRLPPL
jgi:hypothetical protein